MLTQQNLLDRLNQLTLQYNLTWKDIQYDADKAIAKINSFLGTEYPAMSEIMDSPTATYSMESDGVTTPYFPEEYMHSIVIPFIAMEVLSRQEEFTTIYNKYAAEVEDGLFTMFQREFNRVPLVFRQNPDRGVFFASDSAIGPTRHNVLADLPVFKFRVYYHVNNTNIVFGAGVTFIQDTRAYYYDDTAVVKGWNLTLLSLTGATAFIFKGWRRSPGVTTEDALAPGAEIVMQTDVHLYAVWDEVSTLNNVNGLVTIKDEYKYSLTLLIIPERINNVLCTKIGTSFLVHTTDPAKSATNLMALVLPKYLSSIEVSAFSGFQGSTIEIQETPVAAGYAGVTIKNAAFTNTPNLAEMLIPTNVVTMTGTPFPVVTNKNMTIRCRSLLKPDGWAELWAAPSDEDVAHYTVDVVWGYNG